MKFGRVVGLALATFGLAFVAGLLHRASERTAWATQPPPATLRIPIVRAHPMGTPAAAARFSHVSHRRIACYQCHPSPFPQAAWGFTHDDIRAGRACGACHDGERASAVTAHRCEECHAPK